MLRITIYDANNCVIAEASRHYGTARSWTVKQFRESQSAVYAEACDEEDGADMFAVTRIGGQIMVSAHGSIFRPVEEDDDE